MSDEEYRRRILAVEAYCDRSVRSSDWRTRYHVWYATDIIEYLSSVIDADCYGVPRPQPVNSWCARELEAWDRSSWTVGYFLRS